MKSTWVAAGLLLVTICQTANLADPGPSSTTPIPGTMVFDKINYIGDESSSSFEICLMEAVPDAQSYRAVFENIEVPIRVLDIMGTVSPGTQCIVFDGDIKQLGLANIYILITALSDGEIVTDWGETHFASFPVFPTDGLTASYADDPLATENVFIVLRVEGALNDMTNINELIPITIEDDILYYIGGIDPTTLIPCSDTEPEVCDAVLTPVKTTTPGPDVGSAILTYSQGAQPGKMTGEVKSAIVTSLDQLEVIISTDDKTNTKFCHGPYSEKPLSCEIEWNNPGEKIAQIRIMGIKTGTSIMAEINGTTIHDRELIITQLGSDILEGRWIMHETGTDNQIYRLKVHDGTNDETADVDCTEIKLHSHCFGYKPVSETAGTPYTFTVTNKYSKGFYNELEQIKTTKTVQATDPPQDLQIHVLPMEWHQNLMEVNTTICFSHETPKEEMIFSHYEMLLINTRGQWLKHKVMEEDDNEDVLCFTPFTINTQELDVTEGVKVVVSQRASDGFSVIASGGSPLF